MFRKIRAALEALVRIAQILEGVLEALHGLAHGVSTDESVEPRVAALERELERRHAEAEGLLLKAKGKFDAARASEERARRLAESSQTELEPLEELAAEYQNGAFPQADGDDGGDESVPAVFGGMASRHASKSSAYAMKWSRRG